MKIKAVLITFVLLICLGTTFAQGGTSSWCTDTYARLMQRDIPSAAQNTLSAIGESVDPIESGVGPYHYDDFEITVEMPAAISPETFLYNMAYDLNGYIGDTSFNKYVLQVPQRSPGSGAHIGDVYFVDLNFPIDTGSGILSIPNGEDGSVILTSLDSSRYILTTITDKSDLFAKHPTPGNREWGFVKNADNTVTFYTKGYSRAGEHVVNIMTGVINASEPDPLHVDATENYNTAIELIHDMQKKAWQYLMKGIGSKIARLGGKVVKGESDLSFESAKPLPCNTGASIIVGSSDPTLNTLEVESSAGGKSKVLDLVFVIDTTSSMEDDIDQAKIHAEQIINQIANSGLDWRLALVTYRDYPDGEHGETGDYQSRVEIDFSTDANLIRNAINALVVSGGGDGPESVYSGLMDAMALNFRAGAQKTIVLLGDAPPHDPEPFTGYTRKTVLKRAFNLDPVNMYPILISDDPAARKAFASLADGTSGRIFSAATADQVVSTLLSTIQTATGDTHLTVGGYARVFTTNGDTLNLRADTNTGATILGRMATGTVVKITSGPQFVYPYIWWAIESPDGISGYSVEAADGVATLINISKAEVAALPTDTCIGIPSGEVNIRSKPTTASKIVGTMLENAPVTAKHLGTKFYWFALGSDGWVRGDTVALEGNCKGLAVK